MLNRRKFIKVSAAGVAAAGVLPGCAEPMEGDEDYIESTESALTYTKFAAQLPIAPAVMSPTSSDATTDYYSITMAPSTAQLASSGPATNLWTYNGTWPGPTMRVKRGRPAQVTYTNNVSQVTSIHNHGHMVPATSDGHPTDYIYPGFAKTYYYPNNQLATTLWYHDHAMDKTGEQVYRGLAGFYIIESQPGDADYTLQQGLPSGNYDYPLVFQDRKFDANNQLVYGPLATSDVQNGWIGDTAFVNGLPVPTLKVEPRKYRFRLLNGSNARMYFLKLLNGTAPVTVQQVGSDGGLLPARVDRTMTYFAPGERLEVVIDFTSYAGRTLQFKNYTTEGGNKLDALADIMRFDVSLPLAGADTPAVPSTLLPITRLVQDPSMVTRTVALDNWNSRTATWTLNGKAFDAARIDFDNIRLGTTEVWLLDNNTSEVHPFHIHLIQFQVLDMSIKGSAIAPYPWWAGWKDTIFLPAWTKLHVIMKWEGYAGTYVCHCHKLEHEDHGMMMQIRTVP